MNFRGYDWRERRNILNQGIPFNPLQYTISNYSTDCFQKKPETDLDEEILQRFHAIPDPLKKNLADTVISNQEKKEKVQEMPPDTQEYFYEGMDEVKMEDRRDYYPSLAGITNFFSNFFGAISGVMFQRREKPAPQYNDCYDLNSDCDHQMSLDSWHTSKFDDQNKKGAPEHFSAVSNDNMNNCRATVAHCENKLNVVRSLLSTKPALNTPRFRSRRPRKVFVEPGSVEESFEEAFSPEDFVSLPNGEYVEYISVPNNHNQEFCETDAPKMKTEVGPVLEKTEIVNVIPQIPEKPEVISSGMVNTSVDIKTEKQEVILSCEDKMAKLKSLLQGKCKKNTRSSLNTTNSAPELVVNETVSERPKKPTKTVPIDKTHDKRYKNPNRLSTDKRKHSKLRKNIQEDMLFAREIDSEEISSVDNSPVCVSTLERLSEPLSIQTVEQKDYFDELKGRFHSSSTTESEDSFQIVFTDSPKLSRMRRPSECDSEDSFIVFEDSPDSCYTSNDVFGDHQTSEDSGDYSDSESDISDSGCGIPDMKLSHNLSRTISDLTDDSLYVDGDAGDVVDCAVTKDLDEIALQDIEELQEDELEDESLSEEKVLPSSMLTDAKKLRRKDQPSKMVSFSAAPPKVHVMRVWTFAARQARAGHWERHAVDRERFKRRIADVDMAVSWVLKPQHRSRVMFQRFMPWWNAQRRKEIAEKKQREADKVLLEEEEKRAAEEEEKRAAEEEEKRAAEEEEKRAGEEESKQLKDTIDDKTGTNKDIADSDAASKKDSVVNEVETKKSKVKKVGGKKSKEIIAVKKKLADLNLDFVKEEISGT